METGRELLVYMPLLLLAEQGAASCFTLSKDRVCGILRGLDAILLRRPSSVTQGHFSLLEIDHGTQFLQKIGAQQNCCLCGD